MCQLSSGFGVIMKNIKMKKIPNWSDYAITEDGKVLSKKRGDYAEMMPSISTGYAKVSFSNGTEKANYQVHRLVAEAFIKNPKKLEIVNHIDGNKLNNHVSNLEWVTRKGNAKHYSENLAKKYAADRKAKKDNELKTKLAIIHHAHSACTSNPELFYSVYNAVMKD